MVIINQLKELIMKKVKFIIYGLMFFSLALFTSCLKYDLPTLPVYTDCNITNIYYEYRYYDSTSVWIDNSPIVKYVTLTVTKTIDANANTVTVSLVVPAASGTFTVAKRANVALTNLIGSVDLSTAAIIAPIDGAPVLGMPGDFSAPRQYKVTAADGVTTKTWTITVTSLAKP
jgi:hypothetical protein